MSIKKQLTVAGLAIAMCGMSSFADVEVTPYGSTQYRLRFQQSHEMPDKGDSYSAYTYSNFLAWRMGTKVKIDDQLSLQFQFGNDWGRAEGVDWYSNHSPFGHVGTNNFYAHLAYARWSPDFMFIEAGIIPLVSNGTLDLLANSLLRGDYANAGWNFWSEMNNSIIGLKLGAPILKDDVKFGVELTQAVVDTRGQELKPDAPGNYASVLLDLQAPIEAGAVKITPEITTIINRNYNDAIDKADHEFIFGLAGGYKVDDNLSFSFNGGFGMVSNKNSMIGSYGSNNRSRLPGVDKDGKPIGDDNKPLVGEDGTHRVDDNGKPITQKDFYSKYSSQGYLVGAGVVYKNLGPGNLTFLFNYNGSENTEVDDTDFGQLYTDLRYAINLHKYFTLTPRYRTFIHLYPGKKSGSRIDNRFEIMFDGSF